jgi:hypothetical protein
LGQIVWQEEGEAAKAVNLAFTLTAKQRLAQVLEQQEIGEVDVFVDVLFSSYLRPETARDLAEDVLGSLAPGGVALVQKILFRSVDVDRAQFKLTNIGENGIGLVVEKGGLQRQSLESERPRRVTQVLEVSDPNDIDGSGLPWSLMVRYILDAGYRDEAYFKNYKDTAEYMGENLERFVSDPEAWRNEFLPNIHRLMVFGKDGSERYLGASPEVADRVNPGEYRKTKDISAGTTWPMEHLIRRFADRLGDPYNRNQDLFHPGVRRVADPLSPKYGSYVSGKMFVPPSYEAVPAAVEEMRQNIERALAAENPDEVIYYTALAYRTVRYHPFNVINNSWAMNMVNTVLRKKGLNQLAHFEMDMFTQRLSLDNFAKAFRWFYDNFAENLGDVEQRNAARRRSELFADWIINLEDDVEGENRVLPEFPEGIGLTDIRDYASQAPPITTYNKTGPEEQPKGLVRVGRDYVAEMWGKVGAKIGYNQKRLADLGQAATDRFWLTLNNPYIDWQPRSATWRADRDAWEYRLVLFPDSRGVEPENYLGGMESFFAPGKVVVDLGSGWGRGAWGLARDYNQATIIGVDENYVFAKKPELSRPGLQLVKASWEQVPVPDQSVDSMMSMSGAFTHGNITKVVEEVTRMAKPGAVLRIVEVANLAETLAELTKRGWRVVKADKVLVIAVQEGSQNLQGQTLKGGRVEVVSGSLVQSSRKEIVVGLATKDGQREIKLVVEGNSPEEILAGIARQLDEAGVISGTEFTLRVPISAPDAAPTEVVLKLRYEREVVSLQGQALKAPQETVSLAEEVDEAINKDTDCLRGAVGLFKIYAADHTSPEASRDTVGKPCPVWERVIVKVVEAGEKAWARISKRGKDEKVLRPYRNAVAALILAILATGDTPRCDPESAEARLSLIRALADASLPVVSLVHKIDASAYHPQGYNPTGNPDYRPYPEIIKEGIELFKDTHPDTEVVWRRDESYVTAEKMDELMSAPVTLEECVEKSLYGFDIQKDIEQWCSESYVGKKPIEAMVTYIKNDSTGDLFHRLSPYNNPFGNVVLQRLDSLGGNQARFIISSAGSSPYNLGQDDFMRLKIRVEIEVQATGKPVSAATALAWLLEEREGDLGAAMIDLADFMEAMTRWSPSLVTEGDQTANERAIWMQTYIKDEYSVDIPYTNLPVPDPLFPFEDTPLHAKDQVYYDFSGRNRVGEPFHAANLVALLNFFPPETITAFFMAERLTYLEQQGMGKTAGDLLVINDLYEIDDLLMAYDNSGAGRLRDCAP